jgi:hypothetical protein
MAGPIWQTPAGFLGTLTERRTTATNLVAVGSTISYSLISGSLPVGLYLNSQTGQIIGTPVSVSVDSSSTFVVRAKESVNGVSDRTFSYVVIGPTEPLMVTPAGSLPIGRNGEYFTINNDFVDYTLRAETDVLRPGNSLKFYIADRDGQLPPGLTLSEDGRIYGYVKDSLDLDVNATIEGGYDSEAYDQYPYNHAVIDENEISTTATYLKSYSINDVFIGTLTEVLLTQPHDFTDGNQVLIQDVQGTSVLNGNTYYVKVINSTVFAIYNDRALTQPIDSSAYNSYTGGGTVYWGTVTPLKPLSIDKIYQFYVTVTDGIASTRKLFSIQVVDNDSLRVDTTYISVDEDIFNASAGYLLSPIWQSKYGDRLPTVSNLGSVRANKSQVLSIYDYDPYPLQGPKVYDWNTVGVNPDIEIITDGVLDNSGLNTKNQVGDLSVYYKNANLTPVKGMKIQFSDYIPHTSNTIYTITGVIPLSATSGILNIDQPLSEEIPDNRRIYVGTQSVRPPGLKLDPTTGNIYGKLAYQPSYNNTYRFTVKIVKIDQSTGDSTLFDAIGDEPAQIVGKIYTTLANDPPVGIGGLPTPSTYTGAIGDIVLVGESPFVQYPDLLPLMDGTIRAYVFVPQKELYTVTQESSNAGDRFKLSITKGSYPEPQTNWTISNGGNTRIINTVTDQTTYWELDLNNSIVANNATTTTWTLSDGTASRWEYLGHTVATNQIYMLSILGEIPSTIQFISSSSLGTLISGEVSELQVKAINNNTNYSVTYEIVQGRLPPGLTFNADGTIEGKVINTGQTYFDFTSTNLLTFDRNSTTIDKNWKFTVRASDAYRVSAVEKEFFVTVFQDNLVEFTRIYLRPFLTPQKRSSYQNFITNTIIFDPALIYRPNDPEFGIQQRIKMVIESAIQQVDKDLIALAMQKHFYRKKFYFGEVKSISAKDSSGKEVYELIYVEIIDDQMIDKITNTSSYVVSIGNMRTQLESIDLGNQQFISVDERLMPKYMTTLQEDTGTPIGFVKAVPLCYTIPGGSIKILSRIKNALDTGQFDFKDYNFDTDRIIIETDKNSGRTDWVFNPTERR